MKKICIVLAILICFCGFSACNKKHKPLGAVQSFSIQEDALEQVENKNAKVVILIGQSNATGCSLNSYFEKNSPQEYEKAVQGYEDVLTNYCTENAGNTSDGKFVRVVPGQGANNETFGPEVGIANALTGQYENTTVFIIKYAWGGSVLDYQWLNGNYARGELYKASINFIKTSLDYVKSKGYSIDLSAICWMQGESDAFFEETYGRYYKNTKKLVEFYRKDLKGYSKTEFTFIDAGIAEIDYLWVNPTKINDAKKKYAQGNAHCEYFSTQELGLTTLNEPVETPDIAHYDSMSEFELGKKFGEIIIAS